MEIKNKFEYKSNKNHNQIIEKDKNKKFNHNKNIIYNIYKAKSCSSPKNINNINNLYNEYKDFDINES